MSSESAALRGRYTLRLGDSFDPRPKASYSTFRYDFMPASVDQSKPGLVEVGATDDVTVSLAHGTASSVSHTIFKGHKRPCQKDAVLILDRATGEARLERLSMSVQLKKARIEVCQLDLVEKKLALKSGSVSGGVGVGEAAAASTSSKKPPSSSSAAAGKQQPAKQQPPKPTAKQDKDLLGPEKHHKVKKQKKPEADEAEAKREREKEKESEREKEKKKNAKRKREEQQLQQQAKKAKNSASNDKKPMPPQPPSSTSASKSKKSPITPAAVSSPSSTSSSSHLSSSSSDLSSDEEAAAAPQRAPAPPPTAAAPRAPVNSDDDSSSDSSDFEKVQDEPEQPQPRQSHQLPPPNYKQLEDDLKLSDSESD